MVSLLDPRHVVSPAEMDVQKIGDNNKTLLDVENPSPSIPVEIGSPLTPIDGVELSTPNKPAICCCIIDVNEGLDDEFDLNDIGTLEYHYFDR